MPQVVVYSWPATSLQKDCWYGAKQIAEHSGCVPLPGAPVGIGAELFVDGVGNPDEGTITELELVGETVEDSELADNELEVIGAVSEADEDVTLCVGSVPLPLGIGKPDGAVPLPPGKPPGGPAGIVKLEPQ